MDSNENIQIEELFVLLGSGPEGADDLCFHTGEISPPPPPPSSSPTSVPPPTKPKSPKPLLYEIFGHKVLS